MQDLRCTSFILPNFVSNLSKLKITISKNSKILIIRSKEFPNFVSKLKITISKNKILVIIPSCKKISKFRIEIKNHN